MNEIVLFFTKKKRHLSTLLKTHHLAILAIKKKNKQKHIEIFFYLFFPENRIGHLMQIIS